MRDRRKIKNSGMTYVELIVVLGIFAAVSSVAIFDYGKFQDKINIRVLANDIAVKIVEAQKASVAGKWNANATSGAWKPSYGVYFSSSLNNQFIYFADLNSNGYYNSSACNGTSECEEQFTITKGNHISSIVPNGPGCPASIPDLHISFTRPQTLANLTSSAGIDCTPNSIQINLSSTNSITSSIKIFPSGRVEVQ